MVPISPRMILDIFESWARALDSRELREIPGLPFLRLWLRRGTLGPMLARELGPDFLDGAWQDDGHASRPGWRRDGGTFTGLVGSTDAGC